MQNPTLDDAKGVAALFDVEGTIASVEPLERGHIHHTFIATWQTPAGPERTLVQRINDHVFQDVPGLMHNVEQVTGHLRKASWRAVGDIETLTLIRSRKGRAYVKNDQGCWRCYRFVEGSRTFDRCTGPDQAYAAAFAFGNFQARLLDLDPRGLVETIPDFFSAPFRLRQFDAALWADPEERAPQAQAEIEFVQQRRRDVDVMEHGLAQNRIPLRAIHGDTKLNNILFDEVGGQPRCIVDLDTCMPGWSLYDFGDLVRFTAATAAEDEQDLTLVGVDMELYSALADGWLESTSTFMTHDEVELMPFAARLVTFTIGIRFLTDHLAGDTYFRVHRPGHNLDRARVQFEMVRQMEACFQAAGGSAAG